MNEGFGRTRPALQRGKATNDDSQPGVAGHRTSAACSFVAADVDLH